jgi:hypothetical protein
VIDFRAIGIAALAGTVLGSVGSWYLTATYKNARHVAIVSEIRSQATKDMQEAADRALKAERDNISLALQMEVQNNENRQKLDQVLTDNRRLSRQLGGLRDPGKAPACIPVPTDSGSTAIATNETCSGRLSVEASEFLLDFAREADRAAEYAQTCYKWIKGLND